MLVTDQSHLLANNTTVDLLGKKKNVRYADYTDDYSDIRASVQSLPRVENKRKSPSRK